jgi:hypothetical protein
MGPGAKEAAMTVSENMFIFLSFQGPHLLDGVFGMVPVTTAPAKLVTRYTNFQCSKSRQKRWVATTANTP